MLKTVISYMTKVRGGPDVFVVLCQDVSLLYSEGKSFTLLSKMSLSSGVSSQSPGVLS